jgi:hypothetical protein
MKLTAEFRFKCLVAGLVLLTSTAHAAFEPLPVGGRAAGMAEAYTAVVDDVYALYYNPSGVLQIERPEIGSYYSQLFMGLSDNSQISRMFVGYAQPLGKNGRKGGIGASYLALDLPGLYKEETIGLTYGREFKRRYNGGMTLKLLRKSIGTDVYSSNAINPMTGGATGTADPLLASGRSASALGLDLGLQYRLTKAYALGVAARNINAPDVAIGDGSDKAPAIMALALARRLRSGSLDIEVMNFKTASANTRFALGGEHWFKNGFGLRAGGGLGSRGYSTVSFGASYKMESIQFDYAAILPLQGVEGTLGNQQVSLTVRLGRPPVDPLEAQLIKEKEERVKAETEARYAKAERDRLKKQLVSLTETKTRAQQDREIQAANQALEEAKAAQKREQATAGRGDAKADQATFAEYTAALADYNEKVRQGVGLAEKRSILEKVMTKFGRTSIDMSTLKREMKSLQVEEARAKKDFDLSMNFYQRLVQQGANAEERRGMLQRIIQKYKGSGIDIKNAEDEMRLLAR